MEKSHSRRKIDLTGQRYGYLTVIGPAQNVGSRTAWQCLCDCGREATVLTHRLRCGHTKSCGCKNGAGGPRTALGLTYVDGTCVEMIRSRTVRCNNTSGVPGVDWWAAKQRWRAAICFKGKRYFLGSYIRFEDAVKARKRAEEELFEPLLREFAEAVPQQTADSIHFQEGGRNAMSPNSPPWRGPAAGRAAGGGSRS